MEICDFGGGAGLGWTAVTMGGGGDPEYIPPPGLIGWWKLDETTGTSITDSKFGNTGTFTGNANVIPIAGSADGGLSFDGSNDEIEVPFDPLFNVGAEVTIAAWVRPTGAMAGWNVIAQQTNPGFYETYGLMANDTTNQFMFAISTSSGDGISVQSTTTTANVSDTWTHVAGTYDGATLRIYINGVEENTLAATGTIQVETLPFTIGAGYNNGTLNENWIGGIDDVMLFNRGLSAQEIDDIFTRTPPSSASAPGAGNPMDDAIARWKLDETFGTSVADDIGSNDGTWSGSINVVSVNGVDDKGFDFNGIDERVEVATDPGLHPNLYSVSLWFNADSDANTGSVRKLLDYGRAFTVNWSHPSIPISCEHNSGGSWRGTPSPAMPPTAGSWNHIACVYDGTTLRTYINGAEVSTISAGAPDSPTGDLVLANGDGQNWWYDGKLDDVAIFDRALTPAEVAEIFTTGSSSSSVSGLGLSPALANASSGYRGKISAGDQHACGIKPDSSAWCWGRDTNGGIGNGAVVTADQLVPSRVTDSGAFVQIATGDDYSCGIKRDGTLWCWGDDTNGRLGNGATATAQHVPVQIGTALWTQISTGAEHACGVQVSGSAYCWGAAGRLGTGGGGAQDAPTIVAGGSTWISVSAGAQHSCGIKTDGTALCWGVDTDGRLGNDALIANALSPELVAEPGPWVQINAGYLHTCGVKLDGTAYCWGNNEEGQLGIGAVDTDDHPVPEKIVDSGPWLTAMPAKIGTSYSCGIKTNGTAWCWGVEGENLGNGPDISGDISVPGMLLDPGPWASVEPGSSFACGIKTDGSAWCWGTGTNGRLGNGDTAVRDIPERVFNFPSLAPFKWASNTSFEAVSSANIALGASTTISYSGTEDLNGVPNGLSFPAAGQTKLRNEITSGTDYNGLIHHWKLDETAGATIVDTVSGLNGTWTDGSGNSVAQETIAAPTGTGLTFDGSDDVVTIANFYPPSAGTISFWVRYDDIAGEHRIFGAHNDFVLMFYHLTARFNADVGLTGNVTSNPQVANTWYHTVLTYDAGGNVSRLYIDGAFISTDTSMGSIPAGPLTLRLGDSVSGDNLDGRLDDVRVYDRILSDAEILELYSSPVESVTGGSELKIETLGTTNSAQLSLKAAAAANTRSVGIDYLTGALEFGLNNAGVTNWMHAITPQMEILPSGNVGVGTSGTAPFKLNINGGLRVGDDTDDCTPAKEGTLKFVDGETPPFLFCDGSAWVDF